LHNVCYNCFDKFEFLPSVGASGGILIGWKGHLSSGNKIFSNEFGISLEFTSAHNNDSWILTCVYGPCTPEGKLAFLNWFQHVQMLADVNWLVLGDFNLMRNVDNRNRPGEIFWK
jgi:mannosylglycoprotein endo-beta-mannosidase